MSTSTPLPTNSLPAVGLVANLSADERAELRVYGEFITHEKGDTVVEQGLPQAFLHLILDGELRIFIKSEDAVIPLGYAETGEAVGEMTLLEPIDSSAMVVANATTHVWCINRTRFEEFTTVQPAIAAKFLKAIAIQLAHRLRKGSERLIEAES
jgi:CRP-like cAMP-binding protein